MLAYPVAVQVDAAVDAGFSFEGAVYSPAGDAGQLPRLAEPRLPQQRTTGVAGARVAPAFLVPVEFKTRGN